MLQGTALAYGEIASGRLYIESDPIGLYGGQPSTYTYVNGNPLWWTDPKGQSALLMTVGVGALLTAGALAAVDTVRRHQNDGAMGGDSLGGLTGASNDDWPFDYPRPVPPTDTVPVVSTPTNYPTKDPSKCNQQFEDDIAKCKQTCPEPVSFSRVGCVAKAFAKLRACNRIYKPAGSDWTD